VPDNEIIYSTLWSYLEVSFAAMPVEKANWRKVLLSGLSDVSSSEGFSGDVSVYQYFLRLISPLRVIFRRIFA